MLLRLDIEPSREDRPASGASLVRRLAQVRAERDALLIQLGRPVPEVRLCPQCDGPLLPDASPLRVYCRRKCMKAAEHARTKVRIEPGIYD